MYRFPVAEGKLGKPTGVGFFAGSRMRKKRVPFFLFSMFKSHGSH